MSKLYPLLLDSERQAQLGISQRYSKKKKERKMMEDHQHSLINSVNYVNKMKDTLDLALKRKKDELTFMKSVRERHLIKIKDKMEQEEKDSHRLQELRMHSQNTRISHQINLNNSIMAKRKKKYQAKQEVLNDLETARKTKQKHEMQMKEVQGNRLKEHQDEKSISKSKINKFHLNKNKYVRNSYQTMMRDEELKSEQSKSQIQFLETQVIQGNQKVSKKKDKLKSIQDQLRAIREQAKQIKVQKQWENIQNSRISKKSSNTSEILKQEFYFTITDQK